MHTMSDDKILNSDALPAWEKAAATSAPGGDAQALTWVTPEGIPVKPLYTAADLLYAEDSAVSCP
jgi:methylmalonyl-CoA mutase